MDWNTFATIGLGLLTVAVTVLGFILNRQTEARKDDRASHQREIDVLRRELDQRRDDSNKKWDRLGELEKDLGKLQVEVARMDPTAAIARVEKAVDRLTNEIQEHHKQCMSCLAVPPIPTPVTPPASSNP